MSSDQAKAVRIARPSTPLYKSGSESLHGKVVKAQVVESNQDQTIGGQIPQPLDFDLLKKLIDQNPYHSTCVRTKRDCTTGLGFVSGEEIATSTDPTTAYEQMLRNRSRTKVDDVMDEYCVESFFDVLADANEDYESTGNGYFEVATKGTRITGIHHIPAEHVWVNQKSDSIIDINYIVNTGMGVDEWERFDPAVPHNRSRVLHFRKPTAMNRYYGRPDWLSAVTPIDLMQCLQQYRYDFFENRGVPEFMLFLLGKDVGKQEWDAIKSGIQNNIGRGNSHKTMAVNIPQQDIQVQLEKLALEQTSFDDTKFKEGLGLDIVSAHRVPPLLAGIQVPGKMAASNELPNALLAFQLLVISQNQRIFQNKLAKAFATDATGLSAQDFTFRTVSSILDFQKMDTVSRMRQTVPEAEAEGRNLDDGLKD